MVDLPNATRPYRIVSREELPGPAVWLTLEPADNQPPPTWEPGQYLTFQIEVDGHTYMRSYSIATADGQLRILVKKVENGVISRYLIDHAPVGTILKAFPPKGSFTFKPAWNGMPIVYLAAGSGIAPVLTLADRGHVLLPDSPQYLHHAARNLGELYFYDQLQALGNRGELIYHPYLSQEGGRITPMVLQSQVLPEVGRPAKDCVFLLCGPFAWMRSLRITLTYLGVPASQILVEQFAAPTPPRRPIEQSFPGPCQAHLSTDSGITNFPIHLGETILEAAEHTGLHLPYSCRGGVCGSCAVRLTQGKAEMRQNEILSPHDLANGLTLTCTALPTTAEITLSLQ